MQRRGFLSAAALLTVAASTPLPASACRLFPADVTDRYRATQAGAEIGRQSIAFRRETGRFVVDVEVGMEFVMPGAGTLEYRHECREVWDTGWLHALASRTRIGERERYVEARRRRGALAVKGSEIRSYQVSTYVVPSSLWHRDSRLVEAFIDAESGNLRFVRPRFVGRERLDQSGTELEANHYRMRGQLNLDAWYNSDCALVRWDRPIAGGDGISFRLQPA